MKAIDIAQEVADNMRASGSDVPSSERLARLVNRAKDGLVREMEILDENLFTAREEFSVSAGDTYITLPSDFRRLVGLTRTDGSYDQEALIVPPRERPEYTDNQWPLPGFTSDTTNSQPIMYMEGNRLYFTGNSGAAGAMTLTMRYRRRVADIPHTDRASTFTDIPAEYHTLIADRATAEGLSVANPNQQRYAAQYAEGIMQMRRALSRRVDNEYPRVRWVEY